MAPQRRNKRSGVNPVVYKGKALQVQKTVRVTIRTLPANKRAMWARCLSLGLLALLLAGDGMPIKHSMCHERQAWEIKSKLVVESGMIWEVDE